MVARVEPLTTARALRGPFDYALGDGYHGVGVGSMLVVPFGSRRLLGVVVELAERSELPPERLAEPLSALEADVPAELVRLGLWVAREYVSTPARGLALVLPPGTGTGSGRRVSARRSLAVRLTEAGASALTGAPAAMPGTSAAMPGTPATAPDEPAPAAARLGERQRAALEALAARGPSRVSELAQEGVLDHAAARRLERRGLVALEQALEPPRRPELRSVGARATVAHPTAAQQAALGEIVACMDAARDERDPAGDAQRRRLLLHGVTGSGKTEVYLRAVAAALERGRSAIVLVPEIALTPQTAGRFVARFGDTVALLHSRLSARERFDEWARLRAGAARVCVGPRSAVFAPLTDVGLIVVDEEHDASYKQEGDPRYDARRVAERRAADVGAVLLAGSATPRPEAMQRHRRIELAQRADGRALPPVELVSMAGVRGALHRETHEALAGVRRRGEKAIVLLNRRGWSNFLACGECGRTWDCPHCDVTLVLHRAAGRMACHHCGHGELVPGACPDCGSVSVARHGVGTEQLGSELAALLDPLPVFRLDADTVAGEGVEATLQSFDAARSGVLVGTQMVAKGHDFPDVTLGVVLDADATLRFPDFRAEERTFALVAQLAGRSGRGPAGGRVIVQALDPGARALRFAARHDSTGFLAGELERRSALRYPPAGHLIRVVCSSEAAGPEWEAAEAVRERIDAPAATVLGPAALFRRQGRERAQLVVKARTEPSDASLGRHTTTSRIGARDAAIAAVRRAVEAVAADKAHRGVSFAVDVDPQ